MATQLTIASLNVGRLLQPRTTEFLTALSDREDAPDVLCIQDLPYRGLPLMERYPHVAFAPMTNHLINGERAVVGITILSRYFMTNITHHTVWGDGVLKNLEGIDGRNERYLGAESDRLVEKTEDRVLIVASIRKDEVQFEIATTHGMWVRSGVINDVQRKSTGRTLSALQEEVYARQKLVLIGDMNFKPDDEIHRRFTDRGWKNCMPPSIVSTLDPDHPVSKRGINVITDHIMSAGVDRTYTVCDVKVQGGMSDHQALFATVSG